MQVFIVAVSFALVVSFMCSIFESVLLSLSHAQVELLAALDDAIAEHRVVDVVLDVLARAAAHARDAARRELGLEPGATPWIGPHTDGVLPELHAAGVRRLAVLCPAFSFFATAAAIVRANGGPHVDQRVGLDQEEQDGGHEDVDQHRGHRRPDLVGR